jgi:peptide deformylase
VVSTDTIPKLILNNDPRLTQISEEVTQFDTDTDKTLAELVSGMMMTMARHRGQGLAAVQIGVMKRVIIVTTSYHDKPPTDIWVMINPVITRTLNRFVTEREGCLSIPGLSYSVSRPAKCDVTWQDLQGNTRSWGFSGSLARAVQHEVDHLNGILISSKN